MKILALFFLCIAVFAQQPDFRNAKLETRTFSGDLSSELRSVAPAWFGYSIKTINTGNEGYCWNGNSRWLGLEGQQTESSAHSPLSKPVPLEGTNEAVVLLRVEKNAVGKVHLYSLQCSLDAGGLPVTWLNGVAGHDSAHYLKTLVGSTSNDVADGAIFAISQHIGSEADNVLAELSTPTQAEHVREKVAFWSGASRGASGLTILKNMIRQDPSSTVRDKAVFALSISKQPQALEELIRTAKSDLSAHVRSQAIFWLGQKAGKRAMASITDAIQNDPDTEVKKRAVFALSQLPKEEGIPKLIEIARTQKNPEVQKQAFFWLGQLQDARSLAFFQEVLSK